MFSEDPIVTPISNLHNRLLSGHSKTSNKKNTLQAQATKHLLYRHYNTKVSSLFSTANPIILFARYKSVAANSRSRFPHIRVSVLPVPPLFDFVTCLPAAVILRSVWRPYSFALLPCRRTHTSANLNETGP